MAPGAVIYISADGVTIDGFEIDGTTVCNNGIYGWDTSGLTIKNNKIHGAVNAWDGCGILLISWGNSGTVYNNLIQDNEIYDTGRMGIMVMDHGADYTVTSGNTITGNTVYDVWKVAWGDGGGGIQINVAKDCSITNNLVYDVQNGQRGIYMFGSADGNTITTNTLRNNPIGIQLWISGEGGTTIDWGGDTPTSPEVHYNNIYDNSVYGAISTNIQGTPMVMDATYNWWGDCSGPYHSTTNPSGTGDAVSANVDYCPWLSIVEYGDVSLSGGFQAGHFDDIWDLTQGDIEIQFTYDANGLVDDFGGDAAHAWAELGVRAVGYGDFNPTFGVEGAGVWLATDYDWTANTFDPDPPGSPTLDLDDKLILQKAGGHGEGDYNLPSTPPNPWANHRVWWDRDGVDPWQNDETANTGGIYYVEIRLHATSDTTGEAYMTINGLNQGFETDGNWNTIELTPAGMTFTGDMTRMQVFYGIYGYGATHSVSFKDITIKRYYTTVIDTLTVTPDLVPITDAVALTATFTSPCGSPHTATIDWGDGTIEAGTVSESSGSGTVTGDHTYTDTGVHTVTLSVKDSASQTYIKEYQYVVVYDPSAGFVTGGGWINSPAGAYASDSSLTGKANFGFVSKYKKGQQTLTGNTEFQFKAGDLNFHSDSYDWLVIAGHKAMYKGTGTIKGYDGDYGFMLSAIDEKLTPSTDDVDMFRIKIWDKDAGDAVVYDNNIGNNDDADPTTAIAGGQIVIHKAK